MSGVADGTTPSVPLTLAEFWQRDREAFLEYWHRCEQVAVHFNDLNARFRLQALAGLALAGTLVGAFKGTAALSDDLVGSVLVALLMVWISVAWIDALYYGRLLRGAVREIIKIEQASGGVIGLSSEIESACKLTRWNKRSSRVGRIGFYVLPGLTLVAGACLLFCK